MNTNTTQEGSAADELILPTSQTTESGDEQGSITIDEDISEQEEQGNEGGRNTENIPTNTGPTVGICTDDNLRLLMELAQAAGEEAARQTTEMTKVDTVPGTALPRVPITFTDQRHQAQVTIYPEEPKNSERNQISVRNNLIPGPEQEQPLNYAVQRVIQESFNQVTSVTSSSKEQGDEALGKEDGIRKAAPPNMRTRRVRPYPDIVQKVMTESHIGRSVTDKGPAMSQTPRTDVSLLQQQLNTGPSVLGPNPIPMMRVPESEQATQRVITLPVAGHSKVTTITKVRNPAIGKTFAQYLGEIHRTLLDVNPTSTQRPVCQWIHAAVDTRESNKITCIALLDGSNVWEDAISDTLFRRLGLDIHFDLDPPLKPYHTEVHGPRSTHIRVMGRLRTNVFFQLGTCEIRLHTRPLVIEGLSCSAILGESFRNGNRIEKAADNTFIVIQGHEVNLMKPPQWRGVPRITPSTQEWECTSNKIG